MALTDRTVYDALTVLDDGQIQARRTRLIEDDGVEVTRTHHREVLVPGQDVSAYPARVQALCAHVWTPAVVAAYETARAARPGLERRR